jgi:hypothetical protein
MLGNSRRACQQERATILREQKEPDRKKRLSTMEMENFGSTLTNVEMRLAKKTAVVPDYLKFFAKKNTFGRTCANYYCLNQ